MLWSGMSVCAFIGLFGLLFIAVSVLRAVL